jgi:dimethylaniline monooxygenase (N-oxide forming)
LATAKELLAEGHSVVCFERAPSLGGVFRFGETGGVVWESCRLTSSALLTAFSDFPMAGAEAHPPVGEYVAYLTRYAEHFQVLPHIRFDTTVEALAQDPSGNWTLRFRQGAECSEGTFDAVAVCSGLHQHPHVPKFAGQESFHGQIMHAADYRRPAQVRGKKVLIIGAGESGADVAAEVALNAAETVLSLRRGVAVVPRSQFGVPKDYQTSRLLNSPAHWIFQTRNPADDARRATYRWTFLPFLFVDKALQLTYRYLWEYLPLFTAGDIGLNLKTRQISSQLLAESGGTVNEQFGTKTDDFVRAIAQGRCKRAPGVDRFDGARAVFTDGSEFTPDLVILCTGFETRVPFLSDSIVNTPRFLHTFHPEIGTSLGFIGFVRPAFGAIPPLAELQARWFAQMQCGHAVLPPKEEMQRSIDYWTNFRAHFFRAVKGRLDHLVEFTCFCDELASRIGCKPAWRDLRKESRAFRQRFIAGAFVAAQYRLVGPHAKPELAREIIENLSILHPWPDRWNLHLRWFLSRTLHKLCGPEFAPKLEIEA